MPQLRVWGSSALITIGSKVLFFFGDGTATVAETSAHTDNIRDVSLNGDCSLIATVGDDKIINIYDKQGKRLHSRTVAKKPTCAVFAKIRGDGDAIQEVLVVGSKTGDVMAFSVPDVMQHAKLMLGHTASIITALVMSEKYDRIFSADRDEKVRVSQFPNTASVTSFCLGHTSFVSCVTVVSENILLSGGGDGSVKAWNVATGKELANFVLTPEGEKETRSLVPYSICVCESTAKQTFVVVAAQNYAKLIVLQLDVSTDTQAALKLGYRLDLPAPSTAVAANGGHLYALMPAPHLLRCWAWDGSTQQYTPVPESSNVFKRTAAIRSELTDAGEEFKIETEMDEGYQKKRLQNDYWDRPLSKAVKVNPPEKEK